MKKTVKNSGSGGGFKAILSRKKRKDGVLEDGVDNRKNLAKVQSGYSWSSKTGDIIKFDSINMKKECLVEETSFDYEKSSAYVNKDSD
ncbi:hypothetical protein G9A89_017821 [Geosiphon pyriformis]|nr:hypothetical protein G9A89_017821 [Geosiphon pyriformis]